MSDNSRAYTKDEMLEIFIDYAKSCAHTWSSSTKPMSVEDRVEGAIFSLLNAFDGTAGGFPAAIDMTMKPHPDDKQYCIDNNEKYVQDGMIINDECHLHELFCRGQEADL